MQAFTVIGILTTVLLACLALGGLVLFVTVRLRGSDIRKYLVIDGLLADGERSELGNAFTFWGARRIALRRRGSRIYDRYGASFRIADSGWYERRNGYPGAYVPVWDAAKMLGIAPDGEQGPGMWSSAHRRLDEAHVGVDWGQNGAVEYRTVDVLKLAADRERALAVFAS